MSARTIGAKIGRLPLINYMPIEGREFYYPSAVTIPNQGASAVVVSFKVPQGFNAIINRLRWAYVGGGFIEGGGLILWTLYQDFRTNQAIVMPNFQNVNSSIGSASGPQIMNGLKAKENQVPAIVVANANPGVVPAGQVIIGVIGGYFYPVSEEPKQITF